MQLIFKFDLPVLTPVAAQIPSTGLQLEGVQCRTTPQVLQDDWERNNFFKIADDHLERIGQGSQ